MAAAGAYVAGDGGRLSEDASEDELKGFQDEFKKLRSEGANEVAAAVIARERRLAKRGGGR